MTSTLTKHPKEYHVAVYEDPPSLVDSFDVTGDLHDVKRALRARHAERVGRHVRVYVHDKRGRTREAARFARTDSRGPWLRVHT
jgi:hypothetical protein